MSAFYDMYETPDIQNTGEKQPLHARIVPSGTYTQEEFIERVARYQHFPQNMVGGVVGAVVDELANLLARGYIVELGELGHFSVSLKCTHKVMNRREIRAESIRMDNVHLRTSKEFKRKVRREMRLERIEKSKRPAGKTEIPMEKRLQLLQEFLKENGGITRVEYSRLTGQPRLKAIDDLNAFIEQGCLRKRGAGRTVFYVWRQEEHAEESNIQSI